MLDVFNFASPQTANYQEFYGGGTVRDWIKPRGASMVRMLLIGPGGGGGNWNFATTTGGSGGGSGAITQWIGPAIFIPDVLRVSVGAGGAPSVASAATETTIIYQQKDGTGYTLLTANGGTGTSDLNGGAGASATANNFFGASGIYRSIAGQAGRAFASSITRVTTTFLSGGAGGAQTTSAGGSVPGLFGYPTLSGGVGTTGGNGGNGYFLTQPIFLGFGGAGGGGSSSGTPGRGGNGGIGCGGGGAGRSDTVNGTGGRGGDGAVFIWSW